VVREHYLAVTRRGLAGRGCSCCAIFAVPLQRQPKHFTKMTEEEILDKYYPEDNALRRLLIHHSEQVARRALDVAERHPELRLDRAFLRRAAMLHDIGIFLTDAPSIHCHGTAPYLLHGRLGAELMRSEGDECVARVCERHTGTGLTAEVIARQGLPLPTGDYTPQTLEEQVICYADKFYSKSHPERERSVEQTAKSLEKFGSEGVAKFLAWHAQFG